MAQAIIAGGKYYHPGCAPDEPDLEETEAEGFVCADCGVLIEEDDEDDEDDEPTVVEKDDD